jgi:hypothetical protein
VTGVVPKPVAPASPAQPAVLCWICGARPADSGEHRFKASDLRSIAPGISRDRPVFLQRGRATNDRVLSARSRQLQFAKSICTTCNDDLTQPYDRAWEKLSAYLTENWGHIVRRRCFNLGTPFPGCTRSASLDVHLFFLKLFGCKVLEDKIPIDLATFSTCLLQRRPHAEVRLLIADCKADSDIVAMYDSEVYAMRNQHGELDGAIWLYQIGRIAVKVGWIRAGRPLHLVGYAWHPSAPGKLVKLSPFSGATEPDAGPRALLA